MRPIKLIKLESDDDVLRRDVFTEDDVTLLKQLRIGRFFNIGA